MVGTKLTYKVVLATAIAMLPFASFAQSILNITAGEQQNDGTYLWSYKVTALDSADLNFWILGTNPTVFSALVDGSLSGASAISYVDKGNANLISGLRFDGPVLRDQPQNVSFRLNNQFGEDPRTKVYFDGTATLRETNAPTLASVPEPSSLSLMAIASILSACYFTAYSIYGRTFLRTA